MKRRVFIAGLGAAAAWPLAAKGQPSQRVQRLGILSPLTGDNPEGQARQAAFMRALQQLGWIPGSNVEVDERWGAGSNVAEIDKQVTELLQRPLDVIVVGGNAAVPLLRTNRTVPVVFVNVIDPVGAGLVDNLARPGGIATGFTQFEYSTSGKWLELLKEIVPDLKKAGVLRDSTAPSGLGQFAAIQSAAIAFGLEVRPINVLNRDEIGRAFAAFASEPNGGLIVAAGSGAVRNRDLIISLAQRYRLPTIFNQKFYVAEGGLVSYGPDLYEQWRLAAVYVDCILKGEKAGDLPVQAPTKYELAVNLKTARTLGIDIPPGLLIRADEVIE